MLRVIDRVFHTQCFLSVVAKLIGWVGNPKRWVAAFNIDVFSGAKQPPEFFRSLSALFSLNSTSWMSTPIPACLSCCWPFCSCSWPYSSGYFAHAQGFLSCSDHSCFARPEEPLLGALWSSWLHHTKTCNMQACLSKWLLKALLCVNRVPCCHAIP